MGEDSGGGEDPGAADEGETGPEPLYVIGHTVYSPDGATSYLTVARSLDEDTEIDTSRSLELAGVASPKGVPGQGKVYVTSSETAR